VGSPKKSRRTLRGGDLSGGHGKKNDFRRGVDNWKQPTNFRTRGEKGEERLLWGGEFGGEYKKGGT